jgi:hypothetical protein
LLGERARAGVRLGFDKNDRHGQTPGWAGRL